MPPPSQWLRFGPFRLDRKRAVLWKGNHRLPLRPQALFVLQYLAERPDQVIPAQELLAQNWSSTHVTDTVLRVCIRDIRQILEETAAKPQYVQTVRGQGYRFCGQVEDCSPPDRVATDPVYPQTLIGREQLLSQLHTAFQRADGGEPQVALVSGEAGMGKTATIHTFLSQLTDSHVVYIGHGQCAEHTGPGEAYMPVLEALGRLGRASGGKQLVAALHRAAPTWLDYLPLLAPEFKPLRQQDSRSTPVQMQRELVDALTLFAADAPLVLVLEDLHWSDMATSDLITYIARRREPSRFLVIGAYRPADLVVENPSLQERIRDLSAQSLCQVLPLPPLTEADVAAYAAQRLDGPVDPELTSLLHQRAGGNALFMVNALAYLLEHNGVVQQRGRWIIPADQLALVMDIPASLRQFILRQIDVLPLKAQLMLGAASIAGNEFSVAAVAAILSLPLETVEVQFSRLAGTGQLLQEADLATWPDGTVSSAYRFRHTLCRQVCYERLGAGQRVQYHRRLSERLALAYSDAMAPFETWFTEDWETGDWQTEDALLKPLR